MRIARTLERAFPISIPTVHLIFSAKIAALSSQVIFLFWKIIRCFTYTVKIGRADGKKSLLQNDRMVHDKEVNVSRPRPSSAGHKKKIKLEHSIRHILFNLKMQLPFGLD